MTKVYEFKTKAQLDERNELNARIARIQDSLAKINKLMKELRDASTKVAGLTEED